MLLRVEPRFLPFVNPILTDHIRGKHENLAAFYLINYHPTTMLMAPHFYLYPFAFLLLTFYF